MTRGVFPLLSQRLANRSLSGLAVTLTLDEHIQHTAVLVYGPP